MARRACGEHRDVRNRSGMRSWRVALAGLKCATSVGSMLDSEVKEGMRRNVG